MPRVSLPCDQRFTSHIAVEELDGFPVEEQGLSHEVAWNHRPLLWQFRYYELIIYPEPSRDTKCVCFLSIKLCGYLSHSFHRRPLKSDGTLHVAFASLPAPTDSSENVPCCCFSIPPLPRSHHHPGSGQLYNVSKTVCLGLQFALAILLRFSSLLHEYPPRCIRDRIPPDRHTYTEVLEYFIQAIRKRWASLSVALLLETMISQLGHGKERENGKRIIFCSSPCTDGVIPEHFPHIRANGQLDAPCLDIPQDSTKFHPLRRIWQNQSHAHKIPFRTLYFAVFIKTTAVTSRGQADTHLRKLALEPGNFVKRGLQSSSPRSFEIEVTFINSINLAEDYPIEITFDGDTGPVGTFTVYAPGNGETEFFNFCLNAAGETEITYSSDMDDTLLIIVSILLSSYHGNTQKRWEYTDF